MSDLDEALALRPTSGGNWLAFADPRYESINAMFGGWTAAILLRAAMDHGSRKGSPVALHVNYLAKVEPGTEVTLRAQCVGASRSLQHWQATLLGADGRTLAQAMVVFGERPESDGFTEPRMPQAPKPETLEGFHPPGPHGERVWQRPVVGHPPFGRTSSASLSWARELSGRPIDHLQLAFLSDCHAPRIWFAGAAPRMSVTTTLGVHFLATDRELGAVGDDYVLMEVVGTRGADSAVGEQVRLWSAQGVLLATAEQLCWYR